MIDIVLDVRLPFNYTPLLLVNQRANNKMNKNVIRWTHIRNKILNLIVETEIPAILGRMKLNVTLLRDGCRSVWKSVFFLSTSGILSHFRGKSNSTLKDIQRDIRDETTKKTLLTSLHSQTPTFIQYQCFKMLEKEVDRMNFAPVESLGKKKKNRNIPYILH